MVRIGFILRPMGTIHFNGFCPMIAAIAAETRLGWVYNFKSYNLILQQSSSEIINAVFERPHVLLVMEGGFGEVNPQELLARKNGTNHFLYRSTRVGANCLLNPQAKPLTPVTLDWEEKIHHCG